MARLIPIERQIISCRGNRVILDESLAAIYGVSTKRLNEQVKRNRERFPEDFCFSLTVHELESVRSQNATASKRTVRYPPTAFTEHGAIMAANVLKSNQQQNEHYKKKTFQEEYVQILKRHSVQYDDRYIFEWIHDKDERQSAPDGA